MRIKTSPVSKIFKLEWFPVGEEAPQESDRPTITVRQATTGDNIKLADFVAEASYGFDAKGMVDEVTQRINNEELKRARVFLTLCGDSGLEDEQGNSLFTYAPGNGIARLASETVFNKTWASLPPGLTDEIYQRVLEVNPQWGLTKGES